MRKTNFIIVAIIAICSMVSCNITMDDLESHLYINKNGNLAFKRNVNIIKFSGETSTKQYEINDFSQITMNSIINVEYYQTDSIQPAVLICNKELLPFIDVYVKNGILHIEESDSLNKYHLPSDTRTYKCTLRCYSKMLTNVKHNGFGDITLTNSIKGKKLTVDNSGFGDFTCLKPLELDELEINISGNGMSKLCGTFKNAIFDISGFGDININGDLTAQSLSINCSGSGDIVFSKPAKIETLKIDLSGFGDIDIDELESTNIDIDCSGSGNSTISKINTQSLNLNISGYGDIDITDLKSTNTDIDCNGSGDITIPKINNKSLDLKASGYGDIRLDDGFVENLNIDFSGSGSFEAKYLKADNVTFKASGYGEHYIGLINKSMDVLLRNSTSLTYSGNPEIQNINVSGNASIHKRNNNE